MAPSKHKISASGFAALLVAAFSTIPSGQVLAQQRAVPVLPVALPVVSLSGHAAAAMTGAAAPASAGLQAAKIEALSASVTLPPVSAPSSHVSAAPQDLSQLRTAVDGIESSGNAAPVLDTLFDLNVAKAQVEATRPWVTVGETVITDDGYVGRVVGIYPSGDVALKLGKYGYFSVRAALSLARTHGSIAGVKVGDEVYTDDRERAQVVGIYPHGNVALAVYGLGGFSMRPVISLARNHGSINGVSVGDEVYAEDHYHGRVVGIYPDGNVALIRYGYGGYYIRWSGSLARSR